MKIKSIYGENFKVHEDLNLDFSNKKTQVFVGKNGRGKSSAIDMIKYAITGEMPDNAINVSSGYMKVSVSLEDGTEYTRGKIFDKNSTVTVHGKRTTVKGLNDLLMTKSGVPFNVMKIVSSEEVIDNMKPDELSNLLMSYAPEELDIDKIIDFLGTSDPEIINVIRNYFPKMPETFSVESVNEAYKEIHEAQKSVRSVMDDRKSNLKIFNGEIPSRNMSSIDAELEKVLKQEAIQENYKNMTLIYKKAEEAERKQDAEIARLKAEIDAIIVSRPNSEKEKELKQKEAELLEEIINNKTLIKNLQEAKLTYINLLKDLSCDKCPICDDIKCTTDKTSYKSQIQEMLDSTDEGLEILMKKKEKNEKSLNDVKSEMDEYIKQVNLYNRKIMLVKQLDDLKSTKIELPKKPEEIIDDTDYNELKRKLKEERERVFAYEQNLKIQHELDLFSAKYELYKKIIKLLSPKGTVMNNIVEYYLSVYEDISNEIADKLNMNFNIQFEAKDGVQIYYMKKGEKHPIPYNSISSGEKALVMFVLIYMLNILSGFKILIMDNLDKLDSEAFAAILKVTMSKEVQDEFDHIVLSCVDHEDTMKELAKYPDLKIVEFK